MSNNSGNPRILSLSEGGTGASSSASAKFNLGIYGLSVDSNEDGNAIVLDAGQLSSDSTYILPGIPSETTAYSGTIVIKTTTGDASGQDGLFQVNTFDNTFKVFADGAWRSLATW